MENPHSDSRHLIAREAAARRTFAIISHPDAGKTTLTEKLLLYAGMIRTAGMVRGRKGAKAVSSDWMSMERERGISITASAMQFNYKGVVINVLDTPGHQDFSEDTYRTLTAADSAVMVLDAAKGVEEQTKKLFKVCRMRQTPILTFINKMDLPGRDPFSLLSEVEDVLGIKAAALNWPIGSGKDFIGVADLEKGDVLLFERDSIAGASQAILKRVTLQQAQELLSPELSQKLEFELELLREAGNKFSREAFLAGEITPVFFGSAMTNFGIEPFFDRFAALAPAPGKRAVDLVEGGERLIDPIEDEFSGYVFKIQANMDPKHRDSMAFIRICSGQFARDLVIKHQRSGRELRLSRTHSMFGGERNTVDCAFAGDIVGVVNPGTFVIGDTVSLQGGFNFKPLPKFSPEVVARIRATDVGKKKAFDKGMQQLCNEGTVLMLNIPGSNMPLVAAVGKLQFEVLQHRLKEEYRVSTELESLPFKAGAWLIGDPSKFVPPSGGMIAYDPDNRAIFLYGLEWERRYALEKNPGYQLVDFV